MKANAMMFAAVLTTAIAFPAAGQSEGGSDGKAPAAPIRTEAQDICRYEHNYMAGLVSANDGVVESAIANSVRMKWALPSAQLEELKGTLGSLTTGGRTAAIRYKAYLAGLVYDSPSIFNGESSQKYAWDEDLFNAIGTRAQKALLGYSGGSR
ncbi:MAG TPA: hypothetical protein VK569_06220 [Bacteroidota bacterium]|nr:hypothetical protein [Bacteroidota bacterium]